MTLTGWDPLPLGWIKINTDGAFRASIHHATAGGLLGSETGAWLHGFFFNIGTCKVTQAKLWGAHTDLILAWVHGYRQVILEVDSQVASNLIGN